MSDYYATLGVARDAAPDEIKKAYRRLVRELHPDVAGPDSDDRIKEVNQAYEVLSNPEKRRSYDAGVDPFAAGNGFGQGFGFSDLFETFFAAAGAQSAPRGPVPRRRRGKDALIGLEIDLVEAVFGTRKEFQVDTAVVCTSCRGTCCRAGSQPATCPVCGGRGVVQRVTRSFLGQMMTTAACTACSGYGTTISDPCPECAGEGRVRTRRTLAVDVPAGVETGTRLAMSGSGEVGPGGGPAGDLYIEFVERRHPDFLREGDDLHCTLSVPMTAAALGTVITLGTFDGPQEVDLRPGTQPGARLTLRGLGVGHLNSTGRGDLHVHVEVEIPTRLDDAQRDLLANLAAMRGEERPEARLAPAHPGVFSRLKEKLAGR